MKPVIYIIINALSVTADRLTCAEYNGMLRISWPNQETLKKLTVWSFGQIWGNGLGQ